MIEVLAGGLLTTVQDAGGRPGWRHLGVPVGGAADAWSARFANRLAGNPDASPVLEITLGGLELRPDEATLLAIVGGVALVDRLAAPPDAAFSVRAGAAVRIDPGSGARGYLAVAGGFDVVRVLGSAATDLRSGFGGHEGRALQPGDRLATGRAHGTPMRWTGRRETGAIRITPGPHPAREALDGEWICSSAADRTGARLEGRTLEGGEVPSMGLPLGAIQVPPDGQPIVVLADRPVTGGYRVPACVIRADVGRVAQLRPGERLSFVSVPLEEARDAMREAERELAALEAMDAPGDDELGWVGSHG